MRSKVTELAFVICNLYGVVLCDFPFRNISLPWDKRVDDLVSRLTLPDVMFQMAKGGTSTHGGPAPAIPRLGIGPFAWNTECLRGDSDAGIATGFPQAIGLAAAFNPQLIFDVAEATGVEVRAKHNDFVKKKQYGDHKGLACFSPVLNIMRHPLWGRNQETYGEDPYLSGVYAKYFVKGLQGNHIRYVRASAGCKHFNVHGGPENIPVSRFSFDAKVSERDWHLTFLPAFRQCVAAGTYSLMCSFNKINGIPACANTELLTNTLRKKWGFSGYVISDEEAVENIVLFHHYANNSMEATVDVITAGLNLELTTNRKDPYFFTIIKAVETGRLSEKLVRERVKPLFYTRMRLGEFDPPGMNPYLQYNMSLVQSEAHRLLALKAAMQSFVLLKNENKLLPIRKHFNKMAIVGPMADNLEQLYGDYAADVDAKYSKTPLQGLSYMADKVNYAAGCSDNRCTNYSAESIKNAVQNVQLVVICVGTGQELEAEGNDRRDMNLAGHQAQLIQDAVNAAKGTPVILLVFSGGPVNISFADKNPRIEAILQCFFPAQATGEALLYTIGMATVDASPAGRLPYTWYDTADQVPSMTDYSMTGKTYRYFKGSPLYPFGYGLSYTTFEYFKLTLTPTIAAGDDQYLYGQLINTGQFAAYEVVQVYMSWLTTNETMPSLQLVGFQQLFIESQASQEFQFVISAEQMAVWTNSGFTVQAGKMIVYVGGQQPGQKRTVGSNILQQQFEIVGQKHLGKL
ncbi:uncharacterized protein LOC132726918 isoform X1 [Ruditapes philippinarum]|uniref:uncharacterized protein LOC132726918 isoform X1 n=1 Tax=Ruditapes philippinarum TaxID=129788 RepID=UPI00295A8E1D|nr:uncharacterized protein LOC132726918 isoform X1 [Ruditapes philippinarum]